MWIFKSSPSAGRVLSVLRIVVAFMFISAGTMKMFGYPSRGGDPRAFDPFTQIGLAAIIEVVGGSLVLVGLATRPAAFIMSGEMAVAYFQAYAPKAFFPVINGGASAALFCWIFFYFSFVGAGPWSLDALIPSLRGRVPRTDRFKVPIPEATSLDEITEMTLAAQPKRKTMNGSAIQRNIHRPDGRWA